MVMDTNQTTENEVVDSQTNESAAETAAEVETIALPKSEYEKLNQTLGSLKREVKELKKPKDNAESAPKSGELDETHLDYLDLKGITEADDIKVIESVMKRTGQTLRQVLKDDYVTAKLEANKKTREVANAMPSNSKKTGNSSSNDVEYWLSKNAQTGEWPTDQSLKYKVLEAKEKRAGTNAQSWHQ